MKKIKRMLLAMALLTALTGMIGKNSVICSAASVTAEAENTLVLTEAEQEYVEEVGVITVGQIRNRYPITTKFYATDEESFKALQDGEVDLMMQNVYVTSYLLQKPQYSDLQILPTTFLTETKCIATLSETDSRLMRFSRRSVPTQQRVSSYPE